VSESPRLSLWALLSAHDSNIYRAYTKQLVGGGWVGTFEPHVTLLESLTGEVVERKAFEATAAATLPFSIELTGLATTAAYFRCVVAVVSPRDGIVSLRSELVRRLGRDSSDYWPHLSLVYGELGDVAREQLASGVAAKFPAVATIDKICLVDTAGELAPEWPVLATWQLGRRSEYS